MTLAYNMYRAAEAAAAKAAAEAVAKAAAEARNEGIAIGEKLGEERGISLGITQGEHKKAVETARKLIDLGLPQDQIALVTGLSVEEIEKL